MPAARSPQPRSMRGGRRGWNQTSAARVQPPQPVAAPPSPGRRRGRAGGRSRARAIAGLAVVALIIVGGVAAVGVWASSTFFSGTDSPPNADLPAAEAVPPPSVTDPACPTTAVGAVSWGKDAGGTDTGVEAIKKFDFGYYVTRSGEAARAAVAPDALVGDAASLQSSIDAMPVGTTHCLQITDRGNGTFEVRLAEFRPNSDPELTFQVIETARRDGRAVITAIPTNVSIQR